MIRRLDSIASALPPSLLVWLAARIETARIQSQPAKGQPVQSRVPTCARPLEGGAKPGESPLANVPAPYGTKAPYWPLTRVGRRFTDQNSLGWFCSFSLPCLSFGFSFESSSASKCESGGNENLEKLQETSSHLHLQCEQIISSQ